MLVPTTPRPELAELERLGDEIAELSAHLTVATARLLALLGEFDARDGWAEAGAKSCGEWLSWRVGMNLGAAREHVRVARALPELPRIREAFGRGALSYSKVRALTRVATPQTEDRLLKASLAMTAAHVERLVRGWRQVDRNAEHRQAVQRQRSRTLSVYQDTDGMYVIEGRLTPEIGAVLRQALAAGADRLYAKARVNDPEGDPPTVTQRQADALGLIAEAALHHDLDPGAARYQVVVHVDAPVLADPDQPGQSVLEGGDHVSAETSRRLACDASQVVMRHHPDGRVTAIGGPHPDDSGGAAAGARASRPGVSLPGLWVAVHAGASHQALGIRRADDAGEPGAALSAAPPFGARGRLSGRAAGRWSTAVPTAGWSRATDRADGSRGPRFGACSSQPERWRRAGRAHADTELGRHGLERCLRHRRHAPASDRLAAMGARRGRLSR